MKILPIISSNETHWSQLSQLVVNRLIQTFTANLNSCLLFLHVKTTSNCSLIWWMISWAPWRMKLLWGYMQIRTNLMIMINRFRYNLIGIGKFQDFVTEMPCFLTICFGTILNWYKFPWSLGVWKKLPTLYLFDKRLSIFTSWICWWSNKTMTTAI
mgnify:CR=1 FL=1